MNSKANYLIDQQCSAAITVSSIGPKSAYQHIVIKDTGTGKELQLSAIQAATLRKQLKVMLRSLPPVEDGIEYRGFVTDVGSM
jgi:hypothetical protein